MRNPNYPFEAVIGAVSPFGDLDRFINPNAPQPYSGTPAFSDAPYTPAPPGNNSLTTPSADQRAIRDLRTPGASVRQFLQGGAGTGTGNPTSDSATSSGSGSKLKQIALVLALTAPVWGTFLILRK